MEKKIRLGAVEVIINSNLSVSYRITLPIKEQHVILFPREKISSYIRNNKIRYMFMVECTDRMEIHRQLISAQSVICSQKITDLRDRESDLLDKLSNISKYFS